MVKEVREQKEVTLLSECSLAFIPQLSIIGGGAEGTIFIEMNQLSAL
jgi:hypothetical protein